MSGNFESLEKFLNDVDTHFGDNKDYLFRGHSKSEYLIQPSLFRVKNVSEHDVYSYIMTRHYDLFKGMKPLEVLSKMQHLGVATRLLDVTQNPLVGLFFAVDSFSLSNNQDKEKVNKRCCIKICPFFHSKCKNTERSNKKCCTRHCPSFLPKYKCKYRIPKKSHPELLIFPYDKESLKEYDSDTIKLLSCLPLLKDEKQKQLLIDAVNEYLIDVSLNKIFASCFSGTDYEEDLQEIISFIKDFYYLNEKYDDRYGFLYVIRSLGKYENDEDLDIYKIKNEQKEHSNIQYKVRNLDNSIRSWRDNVSEIELEIKYKVCDQDSMQRGRNLTLNIKFERDNLHQGVLFKIVHLKLFNGIEREIIDDSNSIEELLYEYTSTRNEFKSLFIQRDDYEGYRSKSMEELYYKVKDFYPDFRRCASTLDVINGVYVYPIVNTDRMRAQKGLFALYGLSRYWNFKKYLEYQKSIGTKFYDAIYQFIDNDFASLKEQKNVDIRKMEDEIYEITRVSINTNKVSELNKSLKKLGIDKETLGCSLETTYNNFIEN